MIKTDIEQIRIEVESESKNIISMLLHKDGTLNRKGDGLINDSAPMIIGMSDGSAFQSLVKSLPDNLIEDDGMSGSDDPDKSGQPVKYNIAIIGPKPHIVVFEFTLGSDTQKPSDLFLFFHTFVVNAIKATDKWYKDAIKKNAVPARDIEALFAIPQENRDEVWNNEFYAVVQKTKFVREDDFVGPDGFPYAFFGFVNTSKKDKTVLIKDVLEELLTNGKGIAFIDNKGDTQWVFSYGTLWTLKSFGSFTPDVESKEYLRNTDTIIFHTSKLSKNNLHEEYTIHENREVLVAQPSQAFFPDWARGVVARYLTQKGFTNPRVFVYGDPTMQPSQSFVFSVFLEDFSTPDEFQLFMEKLQWYFPSVYSIVTLSKETAERMDMFKPFKPKFGHVFMKTYFLIFFTAITTAILTYILRYR